MKILYYKYDDGSATIMTRAYLPSDYAQADRDLAFLQNYASSDRNWFLEGVELFNPK